MPHSLDYIIRVRRLPQRPTVPRNLEVVAWGVAFASLMVRLLSISFATAIVRPHRSSFVASTEAPSLHRAGPAT